MGFQGNGITNFSAFFQTFCDQVPVHLWGEISCSSQLLSRGKEFGFFFLLSCTLDGNSWRRIVFHMEGRHGPVACI